MSDSMNIDINNLPSLIFSPYWYGIACQVIVLESFHGSAYPSFDLAFSTRFWSSTKDRRNMLGAPISPTELLVSLRIGDHK